MNDSATDSATDPETAAAPAAPAEPAPPPRVAHWCSMLLDLSRRNHLLHFKEGAGAVRLAWSAPERLEDGLADDKTYKVLVDPPAETGDEAFLEKEAKAARLHALPGETGNAHKRLLGLLRAARNDMEEGGLHTLFLALGTLLWKDGKGAKAPVYRAPLVLCPVSLKRLPGKEGFALRRADEEASPNVTLLEMLRREQRIEVPGADPMPEDERGLDVAAVLEAYRRAVAPLPEWSVEPEVWLGRFSFNKFLMWKDLNARLDDLARSPIVSHLLRGGGAFEDGVEAVEPAQVDALSDAEYPLCPLTADSSQLSAVLAAVRGRNFVLHGPPGTGKSQTITNLVAACMAAGKTVLFVAEKRAALEVVQRRLRKVGLAPFCLELHSNKAGKAEVLRQFKEALDYAGAQPPADWDEKLAALRRDRRALDRYVRALHAPHPSGLTPYRAFSWLLAHGADEAKAGGLGPLSDLDPETTDLAAAEALAEALAAAARDVPEDLFEPFAPIGAAEWTPAFADALAAAARPLPAAAAALLAAAAPLAADGGGWAALEAKLLARERGLAGRAAFAEAWPGFDEEAAAALDRAALRAAWEDLPNRFVLARPFRRRALRKRAARGAVPAGRPAPALPAARMPALLDALDALAAARADAAVAALVAAWEAFRPLSAAFAKAAESPAGADLSPRALRAAAEAVLARGGKVREWCRWRAAAEAAAAAGLAPLAAAIAEGGVAPGDAGAVLRKRYCERFARAALERDETLRAFFGNGQDALVDDFGRLDKKLAKLSGDMVLAKLSLGLVKAKKDRALSSEIALLNHEVAKKTRQKPPRQLLEALPGLLPVLKPCLLMSPLSVAQYLPPGGKRFDVVVFDEASQLTVWDAIGVLARGKQAVVVGDPKQLPPTSFFQKAAQSGGAEEEDPAAESPDVEDLDSILDECKAAGVPEQALLWHYRSRHESLIAFSNERYYGGSLFTFPSAALSRKGLGVRRVKVEGGVYDRSRTRTNRKEAEAVVAAAVERLLDPAFAEKTAGIVTFSMAQQSLIEDLLDDEQAKHPEIQRFFDPALPEPFFVKNLENVQGDERDAIYFSIGYAPDEKGAFAMNFGPLNRPGGERRLNVAVTRAREEVVVFTSIDSTQIDLSRTAALGAAHLREFLSYAEREEAAVSAAAAPAAERPDFVFEEEVASFLRCNGYDVDERVGKSGYRVDLAVRKPDDPGAYAIAVECDGAMYRDAASARDRDESRRGVLEGLGWRVARCWCMEWWFDRDGAEKKLLAAVEAAVSGAPEPATAPATAPAAASAPAAPEPAAAGRADSAAALAAQLQAAKDAPDENDLGPYVAGLPQRGYNAANFNVKVGLPFLREQILRIVTDEGPITEELLAERVFDEWGLKAPGETQLRVFRKGIPETLPVTTHQRRRVYWPVGADPAAWHHYRSRTDDPRSKRTFAQLPFEEIAAALDAAARALGPTAEEDDLFRDALRRFGLAPRLSAEMRPVLAAARREAKKR